MHSIAAISVNDALHQALTYLLNHGVEEPSRNGPVLVAPGPVMVEFTNPRNRVLFSPTRDANHVFHVMESLWMLAGSNKIEFPVYFSSTYGQFSDDGKTMWDAYGWRWRSFFGYDQLMEVAAELRKNPTSRRCVLSMWNSSAHHIETGLESLAWSISGLGGEEFFEDLSIACNGGKAVPCNTHAYFAIRDGRLNLTVMNRSNDAIWGAFGANAVHFSYLLEYMAMLTGVPMGSYYLFTNNLHCYTDKYTKEKLAKIAAESFELDRQMDHGPNLEPGFDADLAIFMPWALQIIRSTPPPATWPVNEAVPAATALALAVPELKTEFMHSVVLPMFLFWVYRKWKDEYSSQVCLDGVEAPDWQHAIDEWVERRRKK